VAEQCRSNSLPTDGKAFVVAEHRQQPSRHVDRSLGYRELSFGAIVEPVTTATDTTDHPHRRWLRARHHSTQIEVGDLVSVAFLPAVGSHVRESLRWQMTEEFLLVPSLQTPLDLRTVSASSALGRALVGHRLGDTVEVTTATGRRTVRILAVRRSP